MSPSACRLVRRPYAKGIVLGSDDRLTAGTPDPSRPGGAEGWMREREALRLARGGRSRGVDGGGMFTGSRALRTGIASDRRAPGHGACLERPRTG